MRQRARNGLDREAEIVGDVLARHRKFDLVAPLDAVRHFEQEAGDALLRGLDQQHDVALRARELARRQAEKLLRHRMSRAASAVTALRLITSTFASVIASAENVCSAPVSRPKTSPGR